MTMCPYDGSPCQPALPKTVSKLEDKVFPRRLRVTRIATDGRAFETKYEMRASVVLSLPEHELAFILEEHRLQREGILYYSRSDPFPRGVHEGPPKGVEYFEVCVAHTPEQVAA